ncbi:MAG: IS630 family transposase [Oscillospiraceae bacterium]|nr:IS630 family transposase [Oscillospiraceae bacterium]
MWCIPPEQNADFVAKMEDVLAVYQRPYDPQMPVVCMDEKPFQLLDERIQPIKMSENCHKTKKDCQYERRGSCSIFLFAEPLGGWRNAVAHERRTSEDWANQIKWLLDEQYPSVEKVVLVMDNLNTHNISSLYKIFPPDEAFRLSQRLEIHYTPKHGSWLNIAEIELSALATQCLGTRRIGQIEILNDELAAWHSATNISQKCVDRQFTTHDAGTKLKRLYSVVKF